MGGTGGEIHSGEDGFLFLVGGTNRPLRLYRPSPWRWLRLRGWERLVRERARRAEALGARFLQLVVPEKLAIYPDMAPGLGIDPAQSPAGLLTRRLADLPGMLDLAPGLRAARSGAETYRRKDSHWTYEGALVAHDAICAALGVTPRSGLRERIFNESEQAGDLGTKRDPVETERIRHHLVPQLARRVSANSLVERFEAAGRGESLHRGAEIVYRNDDPGAAPLRIVLFGDSCAHWAPFLLTGMLAETVRDLHFVWSTSFDWRYIERARPDVVIGEVAERFLARVPDDRFDLAAFAAERLAASGLG